MTKREIVKWLERQMNLKQDENYKRYKAAMEAESKRFAEDTKLDETAEKIFNLIYWANDIHEAYLASFEGRKDVHVYTGLYNSLSKVFYQTDTLAKVREKLACEILNRSPQEKAIISEYEETRDKISKNYRNVICHVRALSTAKKAIDYLAELGFDVSELGQAEDPKTLALSVPVDTSYLFVAKAEEEGDSNV